MADFRYDGSFEGRREAFERMDAGDRLVCSRCHAPLVVARTFEEANRLGVTPGLLCPTSARHVEVHFQLRAPQEKTAAAEKQVA